MFTYVKQIDGVPKIRDGYNPATWVLEVTAQAQEELLRVDFADIYINSELHQYEKIYQIDHYLCYLISSFGFIGHFKICNRFILEQKHMKISDNSDI